MGAGWGFLHSISELYRSRLHPSVIFTSFFVVFQVTFRIVCIDNQFKAGQAQTFVQNLSPPEYSLSMDNNGAQTKPYTMVTDRAEQLTGTALVTVRIIDENDCTPEFSKPLYTFSEEENVPSFSKQSGNGKSEGKPIGILQASDRDVNANLTYKLLTNPLDAFQLDSKTGVLYIVRPFDREAFLTSTYEGIEVKRVHGSNDSTVIAHLSAIVSDGKHTAETQVQVTITDVNDCPPVFEKTTYEFFVEENRRPLNGMPIGEVVAHDADAGLNGKIIYRIQPAADMGGMNATKRPRDYNPIRHFKIDPNTGSIYALRPLDREQYAHHVFHVVAVDTSGSPLYQKTASGKPNQFTATATVTVIVNDENDNAPSITFPVSHTTLRVKAGTPAGQQVFTVTATDPDAGENGTVRYTLKQSTPPIPDHGKDSKGGTNSLFSIDDQTGIVLLLDKLPSAPSKYLLTIGAHDLGSVIQRNTSVTAIIHVMPVSIHVHQFSRVFFPGSASLLGSWRLFASGPPASSMKNENRQKGGRTEAK